MHKVIPVSLVENVLSIFIAGLVESTDSLVKSSLVLDIVWTTETDSDSRALNWGCVWVGLSENEIQLIEKTSDVNHLNPTDCTRVEELVESMQFKPFQPIEIVG